MRRPRLPPLLLAVPLLGLARLVERADRSAVVLTVVALVAIVVAGHPETLLFCVTGGGIFFLFELAGAGPGRRLRPILLLPLRDGGVHCRRLRLQRLQLRPWRLRRVCAPRNSSSSPTRLSKTRKASFYPS